MAWRAAAAAIAVGALATCTTRRPEPPIAQMIDQITTALRSGNLERAIEIAARARSRHPTDADVASWSSVVADLLWQDDRAITEQITALRNARTAGAPQEVLKPISGRLGDLLFQAGRWGECSGPLLGGAVGDDAERRRSFATVASTLAYLRKPSGPLLTEQPLLPGDAPEFVCGAGDKLRPFAIDTGTSMTTIARSFAAELGVRNQMSAGAALDGTGQQLAIDVAAIEGFTVGDVGLGAVPVLIVDDAALRLRDLHGGPERVPRGVLGLDVLAAFRLTIDPERRSVVLELPRGLPEGESVQCVRAEGRCLLPVHVEGVRLWFVLDTGASHSSMTPEGLLALPGGEGRAVPSFRRVRTVGGSILAVREVRDLVLRCSEARFVSVTLPVVPRAAGVLFPVHGVLGVDLLCRCRVTLDRGRARILGLK